MERSFSGHWVTSEEFCALMPVNVFHRQLENIEINPAAPMNAHVLFRKKFTAQTGKRAYIYISADDYYKLYINGRFVCQGPTPGYNFHYYYNKADITDFLNDGENTIAVHTYYQGLVNRVWVSGDDRHGLILDIEQDGEIIASSDESFVYSYHSGFESIGTFGYEAQFAQRYISGTEQEGFENPDYDASSWKNARLKQHADYELFEQPTKMLVFEEIQPQLAWDKNGVTVDFGAMYVGYLCAEAKGKANDTIELLFGQELNEDGSVRWHLRANCDYREEWRLSGEWDKLNEFDYKAFRYVRMNIPDGCELKNIYLNARHYPFELKAKPNTDDKELLQIWDLCVRSLKYGPQEVIQDCMEREKGNYLGDGCYTALAHAVITQDTSMLKKLFDDSLRSSFINKGLVTCAACSFMQEIAEFPLMMYYTMLMYYKLTGDKEYPARHYNQMCEILDFYKAEYAQSDGLLLNLDKWCVVEWPDNYRDGYDADLTEEVVCREVHNVINAHYIGAIRCMNELAKILGYGQYCDEAPLVNSYYNAFYDKEKKLFKDNIKSEHISMVSNVFPLMYGFCPDKEAENSIIEYIKEKGFTTVMLFGAFPILAGLKRTGNTALMYEFIKDKNAWLRMLREGATVTFEGWGKDSKWNTSLFHLTLSYAALFLTDWEKYD